MKNRMLLVLLAVMLALGAGPIGCEQSCTLTMFSINAGNVSVMKAGTANWTEAEAEMCLGRGDIVKCGDNSSGQITFPDGSIVDLEAGTELEVASLRVSTGTGSTAIELKQTIGSIILRVTKIIDPSSRYEVETPTGTVAIRGSAVQITVIEDGTTWASNLEGDIWATAQGVELQVPEEGRCIIRPGEPPELTVTFAVAGPMNLFYGEHQWWGAELARDEINAGPGVSVGGEYHRVELVQVDTNEFLGSPDAGVAALQAVIDDVDFVVGGWRTEHVVVYREVAMDEQKIFTDCGASTDLLQFSVVTDYDKYKYWFKFTPLNVGFLAASLLRMTSAFGGVLKDALLSYGDDVAENYRVPEDGKLRVAILAEDALWCQRIVAVAQSGLPLLGFTVVGTWIASPTATDITAELSQIATAKPHIVLTAISGPVGVAYSGQRGGLGIPSMTMGINVEGERKSHWADTEGKCDGEIMLDDWAEDLQNTSKTTAFFSAFVAKTGEYPVYTAETYGAIYQLKAAIETVSATNGWDDIAEVVDPVNIDALIQYLESSTYTGPAGITAYYPMPAIDLGEGVYALSEEQVRALYPSLATYNLTDWLCMVLDGPHIAHDIVYGPGYATGIGSQWQNGHKVGVWPTDFGEEYDEALTDQYGCWNFEYPGTVDVVIPIEGFLTP